VDVRAVIFDIDGTLIDSVEGHARSWAEAFAEFGIESSVDAVRKQIGKGSDKLMPVFVPAGMPEESKKALQEKRATIFREKYWPSIKAFPELFLMLRSVSVKAVLASSCLKEELNIYTERAGILDLYDAAITSDDAASSKPSPDIYQAVLERLAPVAANSCIAIGDTPYDALGATRAGIKAFGVLTGGFNAEELRRAGCSTVVARINDLLKDDDWLRRT
jgi:phosphoglycolate phosphatase-like HAD superfamily hydrolase